MTPHANRPPLPTPPTDLLDYLVKQVIAKNPEGVPDIISAMREELTTNPPTATTYEGMTLALRFAVKTGGVLSVPLFVPKLAQNTQPNVYVAVTADPNAGSKPSIESRSWGITS